jgi:hypothetical protein
MFLVATRTALVRTPFLLVIKSKKSGVHAEIAWSRATLRAFRGFVVTLAPSARQALPHQEKDDDRRANKNATKSSLIRNTLIGFGSQTRARRGRMNSLGLLLLSQG